MYAASISLREKKHSTYHTENNQSFTDFPPLYVDIFTSHIIGKNVYNKYIHKWCVCLYLDIYEYVKGNAIIYVAIHLVKKKSENKFKKGLIFYFNFFLFGAFFPYFCIFFSFFFIFTLFAFILTFC